MYNREKNIVSLQDFILNVFLQSINLQVLLCDRNDFKHYISNKFFIKLIVI